MIERIRAWIAQNGSFKDGLDLYRQMGGTDLAVFEKAAKKRFLNPDIKAQLKLRLQGFIPKLDLPPIEEEVAEENLDPDPVLQLKLRRNKILDRLRFLHASMVNIAKQAETEQRSSRLYELAQEIMEEVQPELNDIYGQLRSWEKEGILPIEGKQRLINETIEKMKKLNTLKSRISRLKGWLEGKKKLSAIEKQQYGLELEEKEAEKQRIIADLGIDE